PVVDAIWRRVLDNALPQRTVPLTDDADVHLIADSARFDAIARDGGRHVFRLRHTPHSIRIGSRSGVPQELGLARDPRCLGVALRQIAVAQRARLRTANA